MANEFKLSSSITYDDSEGTEITMAIADVLKNITTKQFTGGKISVPITEAAIDLGGLATLGFAFFRNLDATNFFEIRTGTGAGNDAYKFPALVGYFFHFGSDITAPFMIANTAVCQAEYRIWAI